MKLALKKLDFLLIYLTLTLSMFGFLRKILIEVIEFIQVTPVQNAGSQV
jgi:hypothetical protein